MPLLSTMVGLVLTNFGDKPIADEIKAGARLATHGKGIDRVLGLNRVVFGSWSNGERMLNVEQAVIMTPGLLSRWLGHQQACGEKEIQSSWTKFATQSNGRTLVFFRLATLNTMDLTDGDESETGQPHLFDQVTIGFGQSPNRRAGPARFVGLTLKRIQDIQDRHPQDVLKTSWDQVVSRYIAWPAAPYSDADSTIRWGKNRLVGFISELPAQTDARYGAFQIQTGSAVRTIRFEMPRS
jgi:hypothetical protein